MTALIPPSARRLLGRVRRFVWNDVLLEIPAIRIRRDRAYLAALYLKVVGRTLQLRPPVTLGEKITHRILYQRNPLHTLVADKLAVRGYVAERVGADILPKLLSHHARLDRQVIDALCTPCIIKCTHGCGGHRVVMERQDAEADELIAHFDALLRSNYYRRTREYHYKHIPPRVLVEELLSNADGSSLVDYKFHMFHGRLGYVQIDFGRHTEHRRLHLGRDFEVLPVVGRVPPMEEPFALPGNIGEMLDVATRLSADFDFVRVDLYNVDGRIVFGELTMTPHAGRLVLTPQSFDEVFGRMWDYPPMAGR